MLLANSNIDNNQRILILAAATSTGSFWNSALPMSDSDIPEPVKYEGIAYILRQCDKNSSSSSSLKANTAKFQKKKRTPEQLARLKAKSQCKTCGNWKHWHSDHNKDGSLKPGVKSSKELPKSLKHSQVKLAAQRNRSLSIWQN